ncbi:uncharacterized protein LOC114536244 [Dendronephthya gigantea]|uniref:uncharacterized protein LOC114536244 n=1 Tax=Dendronephthya gigantea TaxID=151771 RepID=UPI001069828A|nr:uncharacterized protein LOC114536244 [Dendronephthya gigantea]
MSSRLVCFALWFCFVITKSENFKVNVQLDCHKTFHKLSSMNHDVTPTGVVISLANAGVPSDAVDVVVFAKVYSGQTPTTGSGSFINVYLKGASGIIEDERQLMYYTYPQNAVSVNSENMVFPINSNSKTITAQVDGTFPSRNFAATVKIHASRFNRHSNRELN